jgi:hypothetical protein
VLLLSLLRCVAAAGSDPDSLEFAGGLMQRTLLEVAAAADDLVAIFGVAQREPASLFTVWAARQVRMAPALPLRRVLAKRRLVVCMWCSTASGIVQSHAYSRRMTTLHYAEVEVSVCEVCMC